MRLIIQPDYQSVSLWAAHYVAAKIKAANPTPEKPFVLGRQNKLLEEIGYVVETVSIFGRTTAVVRLHNS